MNTLRQCGMTLFHWTILWLKFALIRLWSSLPPITTWITSSGITDRGSCKPNSEEWKTNEAQCTYRCGGKDENMVTVQTSTHAFHVSNEQKILTALVNQKLSTNFFFISKVDLRRLSESSEYFRALSQSRMRETSESLIHLEHVSSSVFHNLLDFTFYNKFEVPQEELGIHIQVCSACISMFIFHHLIVSL